jgi:hypothetical protein
MLNKYKFLRISARQLAFFGVLGMLGIEHGNARCCVHNGGAPDSQTNTVLCRTLVCADGRPTEHQGPGCPGNWIEVGEDHCYPKSPDIGACTNMEVWQKCPK